MSKFYEALKRAKKGPRGNGTDAVSDADQIDSTANNKVSQSPPQQPSIPATVKQGAPKRIDAVQMSNAGGDSHGTNAVSDGNQIDSTANNKVSQSPPQQPSIPATVKQGAPKRTDAVQMSYSGGDGRGTDAVSDAHQVDAAVINIAPQQPSIPAVVKQGGPKRTDAEQTQVLDIKQIGAQVNHGGQIPPQQQGISIVVKEGGPRKANAEQTEALDIKRYLLLVQKRRSLFAIVAAFIMSAAVVVSYVIPPVYEAQTIVAIERNFLNDISKGLAVSPSMDAKVSPLATMMKSRTIISKVISDLDLDVNKKNEAEMENMIKSIQDRTDVKLEFNKVSKNNIDFFSVSFQDRDPKLARDYVNTLVGKYIEENLRFNREASTGTNSFLLEQINLVKVKVSKLDGEIVLLKEKEAAIEESKKKEEEIALLNENQPTTVDARRLELKKLKQRLDYLLVHYTPDYPEVAKVKADIESLEEEIKDSPEDPAGDSGPVRRRSVGGYVNPEASSDVKTRLVELERERDTNQRIYNELSAAYGISQVSAQAEIQDKVSKFRIVDPAILPIKPVKPNRIMIMLLGILAGIAGAFGLIVLLDMSDKSVKNVGMLKNFGLPVLVVPHILIPEESIKAKRGNAFFYGFSGIYVLLLTAIIAREVIKTLR